MQVTTTPPSSPLLQAHHDQSDVRPLTQAPTEVAGAALASGERDALSCRATLVNPAPQNADLTALKALGGQTACDSISVFPDAITVESRPTVHLDTGLHPEGQQVAVGLLKDFVGPATNRAVIQEDAVVSLGGVGGLLSRMQSIRDRLAKSTTGGLDDRVAFPFPPTLNHVSLRALAHAAWEDVTLTEVPAAMQDSVRTIIDALTLQRAMNLDALFVIRPQSGESAEAAMAHRLNEFRRSYGGDYDQVIKRSLFGSMRRKEAARSTKAADAVLEVNPRRAPFPTLKQAAAMIRKHVAAMDDIKEPQRRQLEVDLNKALRAKGKAGATPMQVTLRRSVHRWEDTSPGPRFLQICRDAPVAKGLEPAKQRLLGLLQQGILEVGWELPAAPEAVVSAIDENLSVSTTRTMSRDAADLRSVMAPRHREALETALAATLAVAQASRIPGKSMTAAQIALTAASFLQQVTPVTPPAPRRSATRSRLPPEVTQCVVSSLDVNALRNWLNARRHTLEEKFDMAHALPDQAWKDAFATQPRAAYALLRMLNDAHLHVGQRAVDVANSREALMATFEGCLVSARVLAWAPTERTMPFGSAEYPSAETLAQHAIQWVSRSVGDCKLSSQRIDLLHLVVRSAMSPHSELGEEPEAARAAEAARGARVAALYPVVAKIRPSIDIMMVLEPQRAELYEVASILSCHPDANAWSRLMTYHDLGKRLAKIETPPLPADAFTRGLTGFLTLLVDHGHDVLRQEDDPLRHLDAVAGCIDRWDDADALDGRSLTAMIELLRRAIDSGVTTAAADDEAITADVRNTLKSLHGRLVLTEACAGSEDRQDVGQIAYDTAVSILNRGPGEEAERSAQCLLRRLEQLFDDGRLGAHRGEIGRLLKASAMRVEGRLAIDLNWLGRRMDHVAAASPSPVSRVAAADARGYSPIGQPPANSSQSPQGGQWDSGVVVTVELDGEPSA